MSVILSILLYLADIFTVYMFWGSIEFTVVAACLIPVAVVICMIISFLGIRPKSIKKTAQIRQSSSGISTGRIKV